MTSKHLLASLALAFGGILMASEAVPAQGEPELMMRSGPGSAYQIPVGSSWSSKTPSLNNEGRAALGINLVPPANNAGVWSGTLEGGEVVNVSDEDSALYFDVSINDEGRIVWVRGESTQDGILRYDPVEEETEFVTNAPVGASSWTAVQISNSGDLGYRAAFSGAGNAWVSYRDGDGSEIHLAESGVDSNSPYAFAFTPRLNNNREIAGKAAIDSFSTNQIVIADESGNVTVLVEDNNLDKESPFSGFDNSVGFNDAGQVAFVGALDSGQRGVFLADSEGWTQYAIEGEDGLDDIEFFGIQLNNAGQIAFRGFNDQGQRVIWLADGNTVAALATEGDVVETDLGASRLQSPDEVGGPNFGGAPAINDNGDVAFVSLLTDVDDSGTSHGRGLFIVTADQQAPEIFEDRFEILAD